MSVLNTRNVLSATCGAVLGCALAYTGGGANQLVALAGAVGAVALPVIYQAIYPPTPETDFEPFQLDIDKFTYLGEIADRSLFAYKALDDEAICTYLRIMDSGEYQKVLKEHTQLSETWVPSKGPVITTVVGTVATGVAGTVMFGPFGAVGATIKAVGAWAGICGVIGGVTHHAINIGSVLKGIDEKRANRLTRKIHSLADRISFLEKGARTSRRELIQLRVANAYFQRALQVYANKITVIYR